MTCSNCDQFNTEVQIQSPDQLARLGAKIRAAVSASILKYNSFESDRELIGQPSFMALEFAGSLPHTMRYHFHCPTCGNCYGLFLETYHGSGGRWSLLGNLPSNIAVEKDA
ncbi:MAG: hypothetical protein V4623_11130 [Pseudomonadota bacterium]